MMSSNESLYWKALNEISQIYDIDVDKIDSIYNLILLLMLDDVNQQSSMEYGGTVKLRIPKVADITFKVGKSITFQDIYVTPLIKNAVKDVYYKEKDVLFESIIENLNKCIIDKYINIVMGDEDE